MGGSREFSRQAVDDRADKAAHLLQLIKDAPSVGRKSLIERYVEGMASIHLHWDGGYGYDKATGQPHAAKVCAMFEWPLSNEVEEFRLKWWETRRQRRESYEIGKGAKSGVDYQTDDWDSAVLVEVGEFLKNPQGLGVGQLPCVKRLQRAEFCVQGLIDPPEFVRAAAARDIALAAGRAVVPRVVIEDRELNPPPVRAIWDRLGDRTAL